TSSCRSQSPRPCVAARSSRVGAWSFRSYTLTLGRPSLNRCQFVPPSVVAHTPISVPTYIVFDAVGSTCSALPRASGNRLGGLRLSSDHAQRSPERVPCQPCAVP